MIELKNSRDHARLRRIALAAQGLTQTQHFGPGATGARKAIRHLGYVQIDTISVVERAHHHVLYSRVPRYRPDSLNQMLIDRDIFEYWSHAAAFLPIEDFRFSLPYKHAIKSGKTHWIKKPDRKLMAELLARVRSDGPIRSRDLENNTKKRSGWWDWKPAKKALEQLFMEGDLMVTDRSGFQKCYDLTERVLPSGIDTTLPTLQEFSRHIIDQQLRCHGVISLKGLTYLRRNPTLRKVISTMLDEGVSDRILEPVRVESGEIFFLFAGKFEEPLPRLSSRLSILSPFDNSVIQRDRLKSLFGFEYQLECYLPAAKRQYGYFSLPLLYRDSFIGRMDCKVHRQNALLEIKSVFFENLMPDEVEIKAFTDAVEKFRVFHRCNAISLKKAQPKYLTNILRKYFQN